VVAGTPSAVLLGGRLHHFAEPNDVVAGAAEAGVDPHVSRDQVVPSAAVELVAALRAMEDVGAAPAEEDVWTFPSL